MGPPISDGGKCHIIPQDNIEFAFGNSSKKSDVQCVAKSREARDIVPRVKLAKGLLI